MCPIEVLYSKQTSGPKYMALARAIRGAVQSASLAPGDRLPPVRKLASRIGVTPGTVARTYSLLCDEGLLQSTVGRGTFVAGDGAPTAPEVRLTPRRFDLTASAVPDMGQVALIRSALARAADSAIAVPPAPRCGDDEAARAVILGCLDVERLASPSIDDLMLTHGVTSAVQTVMQSVLHGARPVVLVDELSTPVFARVAGLLRAEIVGVPMDREGLVPAALDNIVAGTGARILCTAPEAHDPTTLCTPRARREAIAEVARRHDLHVLEYDCTRMGAADGPGYRALLPEHGWHVSTMTTFSPWLQAGIIISPSGLGARLNRVADDAGMRLCAPVLDTLGALLGKADTRATRERIRVEFNCYLRAAADALAAHRPAWREDVPHLWLPLPRDWTADGFVAAAAAAGVLVNPASDFVLPGAHAPRAVRIAIDVRIAFDCFVRAIAILADLLDRDPRAMPRPAPGPSA